MLPARPLALLLALALPLAGCLSGDEATSPANATDTEKPTDGEAPVDTGSPLDEATTDAGSRAHKHDYWGGKTEIVLVDATFTPTMDCFNDAGERFGFGCVIIRPGNGSVVYQGTSKLTVTATWDDPKITGLKLLYDDAETSHGDPISVTSSTPIEIPVTQATADLPHTKESEWRFRFFGDSEPLGGIAHEAPVHVTITIYRGLDLPLDPPHPDFWGDQTELDLGTLSGTLKKPERELGSYNTKYDEVTLPASVLVPPGATKLLVEYTYTVRDPAAGVKYNVVPQYKTAAHPGYERAFEREEPQPGTGTFEVEVIPEMTDSPYATESQWRFGYMMYFSAEGTDIGLFGGMLGSPFERELDYTMHFIAYRDAPEEVDDRESDPQSPLQ